MTWAGIALKGPPAAWWMTYEGSTNVVSLHSLQLAPTRVPSPPEIAYCYITSGRGLTGVFSFVSLVSLLSLPFPLRVEGFSQTWQAPSFFLVFVSD